MACIDVLFMSRSERPFVYVKDEGYALSRRESTLTSGTATAITLLAARRAARSLAALMYFMVVVW